jgi:hypothetical protein
MLDLLTEYDAQHQYQNLKGPEVQTSPHQIYCPPVANVLLPADATCLDVFTQINLLCLLECMNEINSLNLTNVACWCWFIFHHFHVG